MANWAQGPWAKGAEHRERDKEQWMTQQKEQWMRQQTNINETAKISMNEAAKRTMNDNTQNNEWDSKNNNEWKRKNNEWEHKSLMSDQRSIANSAQGPRPWAHGPEHREWDKEQWMRRQKIMNETDSKKQWLRQQK